MNELIYTSRYGFSIFFGLSLFIFDTCFESAALATAIYRENLRADFQRSQFFWSRFRFVVITILASLAAQVIANADPQADAMTRPSNELTLYQILLIAGAIASLGGTLFSILGWSRFTEPTSKTEQ